MIRFAWLQARTQTVVAVAALAAAAILTAVTGPGLLHFYDTVVATCGSRNDCASVTTIVAFTGARLAFTYWVRPYLITPLRAASALVMPVGNENGPPLPANGAVKPGDWILSDTVINGAGRVIGQNGGIGPNGDIGIQVSHGRPSLAGVGPCPNKFPTLGGGLRGSGVQPPADFNAAVQECINRLGIREVVTYQPLSRYWGLQWYETLIFAGFAVALAGACFWRVRRSLT